MLTQAASLEALDKVTVETLKLAPSTQTAGKQVDACVKALVVDAANPEADYVDADHIQYLVFDIPTGYQLVQVGTAFKLVRAAANALPTGATAYARRAGEKVVISQAELVKLRQAQDAEVTVLAADDIVGPSQIDDTTKQAVIRTNT